MTQFALAAHTFLCVDGEHVVFLNVKEDRYLALEARWTRALCALVAGWPVGGTETVTTGPRMAATHDPALRLLIERGLLVEDSITGKDATPVTVDRPTSEVIAEESVGRMMRPTRLLTLLRASVFGKLALRYWSLERLLRRTSRFAAARAADRSQLDLARAQELVTSFGALRPFFFASRNACLYECFVLLEFLSHQHIAPTWVFGVQARPFAAHCWLQQDGVVLNDTIDRVGSYTPIMSI